MIVESNTIWWHLTAGLHLSIFHEQIPASTHPPTACLTEVNESFGSMPQMLGEGTDKRMWDGFRFDRRRLGEGKKKPPTQTQTDT